MMYTDFKFDRNKPIKLFEAFAGYGSQYMALKRLGVKVDVVGYSEIDKFAIQVYEALHGKHKNYGGIGSFDRLPPNIDICTWSFPCQDISLAGKQRGMEDGSRSNYGYVFLDTVEATPYHERPKVLLMENVRALFSAKFRDDWREIQLRLDRMGYTNHADVLNAKDYGVAQNRERVFIVSILGEYNYTFPKPIPLTKRLKDYLEDEVDVKYYLSAKTIENTFLNYKGNHKKGGFKRDKIFIDNVNRKEISQTITTKMDRAESQYVAEPFEAIIIPEATKQGYALAQDGDGVYINRPHQKRGVVQKGMIQTIKTSVDDIGVVEEKEILTLENIFDLCGIINTKESVKYERSKPLLQILWKEIGKEEVQQEIRRFYGVHKEKILQQNVYEERLFENRNEHGTNVYECSHDSEEHQQTNIKKDNLRDMWEKFKCGYTSQRWELEEQQFKQLAIFMSELPQQNTQTKEEMYNMWFASKRTWLLQQTLYSLQKIWGSTISQKQSKIRIRKLSPREALRLMDVSEHDIDIILSEVSNTQAYKLAGNSIVVSVLEAIFRNLF